MKNNKLTKVIALALAVSGCAIFALTGTVSASADAPGTDGVTSATRGTVSTGTAVASGALIEDPVQLFTDRELEQEPDLSEAVTVTLESGKTYTITAEGVYVLRGTAENATVVVEADESAKVQLVLDGVSIVNDSAPCVYVKSADKVFVTTAADSSLSVTGAFTTDGDTNTDGVIFSKDDLVLNGTATLTIRSSDNGVVSKDDLKVTGGSYVITAASKCLEANDSIRIADGTFTLIAGTDGLHAENDEDDSLGWIYISGGSFTIDAGDDGIHANAFVQIDGGVFTISAAEGIEGTYIQINDGVISISSWDDGINAARKSSAYSVCVEINGGDITIAMSAGDTDGIDSNGNIIVNGGTVNVSGNSTFDYDGTAQVNGGTVIVNGQQVSTLPNQMMGGGMGGQGGFGGGQPGGQGGFGGGPGGRR